MPCGDFRAQSVAVSKAVSNEFQHAAARRRTSGRPSATARRLGRRALLLAAGCAVGAAVLPGHARASYDPAQLATTGAAPLSYNWAGYANTGSPGQTFSYVAGSWTVPTVTASPFSPSSYSAFWVGLDGYSSNSVEQTGIAADVTNGVTHYSAWWEMYPNAPVTITSVNVSPGDQMSASVTYLGSNSYQLVLNDVTTRHDFSVTVAGSNDARSSAEWIAEAPASYGGILPLADFGTVNFSNASTTLDGTPGVISDFPYARMDLLPTYALLGATTSALNGTGDGFSVTVNAPAATLPPGPVWDASGGYPAAPTNALAGGAEPVWNASNALWSNGTGDVAWNNSLNSIAVFGTTNGPNFNPPKVFQVALGANITAGGMVFEPTLDGSTFDITPGSGSYKLNINGDIVVNTNAEISAALVDNGSTPNAITISGEATLTLAGTNGYTGGTTISSGTLNLTGSLANSKITIDPNSTLTGSGTLNFALGTDEILDNGTLNVSNLNLALTGTPSNPQSVLANYASGAISGSAFASVTPETGYSVSYVGTAQNPNSIVLASNSLTGPTLYWSGTAGGTGLADNSGTWDTTAANTVWSSGRTGGAAHVWTNGDVASIGADTGTSPTTYIITIDQNGISASGITFNAMPSGVHYVIASDGVTGDDLAITGTGIITMNNDATISAAIVNPASGTSGLMIVGTHTLTLSGANTYTGNTGIGTGATLDVTGTLYSGAALGAVSDDGTLDVNNTFAVGNFNGSGTLNLAGGNTLTVTPTAADLFTGTLASTGTGTAVLNVSGAAGAGGKLSLVGSLAGFFGEFEVSKDGQLSIPYATLNNDNAVLFSGNNAPGAGTLDLTSSAASTANLGAIDIADTTGSTTNIIDAGGTANTVVFTAPITSANTDNTGGNTLTLQNGTFLLGNSTNYQNNTGTSFTHYGTLQIGGGAALPGLAEFAATENLPASSVGITLDSGTLELAADALNAATVANNLTLDGNGVILNNSLSGSLAELTVSGNITGTAATGNTDTLSLDGSNTGTQTISGVIGDGAAGGKVALDVTGSFWNLFAINTYSGGTTIDNGAEVNFNSSSVPATGPNVGLVQAFGTGPIQIGTGSGTIKYLSPSLNLANNLTLNGEGTIDAGGFNGSQFETYSGTITNSSGSYLVVQDGTLALTSTGNTGKFTSGTLWIGAGSGEAATVQFSQVGNLPASGAYLGFDAGTLQYTGSGSYLISNSMLISTSNGVIDAGNLNNVLTLDGDISGGTLTLERGIFALNGRNSFSGLQIGAGVTGTGVDMSATARFSALRSLPTGQLILDSGTLQYVGSGSYTVLESIFSTAVADRNNYIYANGVEYFGLGNPGADTSALTNSLYNGWFLWSAAGQPFNNTNGDIFSGTVDAEGNTYGTATIVLADGTFSLNGQNMGKIYDYILHNPPNPNSPIILGSFRSGFLQFGHGVLLSNGLPDTTVLFDAAGQWTNGTTIGDSVNNLPEYVPGGSGTTGVLKMDEATLEYTQGEYGSAAYLAPLSTTTNVVYGGSGGDFIGNNIQISGFNVITTSGGVNGQALDLGGELSGPSTATLELTNGLFLLDARITEYINPPGFQSTANNLGFTGTLLLTNAGGETTVQIWAQNGITDGPIEFNGATLVNNTGPGSTLTFSNQNSLIIDSGGATIDTNGPTEGMDFSGTLSGAGPLTLEGGGTVTLRGAGTAFSGPVTIDQATTVAFYSSQDTLGTGTVTLGSAGATLAAGSSGITLPNPIVLSDPLSADVYNTGGFTDTLFGVISDAATVHGGLTLTGGGTVILDPHQLVGGLPQATANTYSGGTLIENLTTAGIGNSGSFGTGNVAIDTTGGGLRFEADNLDVANNLFLNNTAAPATMDLNGHAVGTWSGAISGPGALTVTDSQSTSAELLLTAMNTYSGGTVIGGSNNAVTLTLEDQTANPGITNFNLAHSNITINAGATLIGGGANGGTLVWNLSNDNNDLISVAPGGMLNISDLNLVLDITGTQTQKQYVIADYGQASALVGSQFLNNSQLLTQLDSILAGWNIDYGNQPGSVDPNNIVIYAPVAPPTVLTWDPGLTKTGSDGTGSWDKNTADWALSGSDVIWESGAVASIGSGGSRTPIITISSPGISADGIVFNPMANASSYYTINGTAADSLTLSGTITMNNNATIEAPIVGSGSVKIVGTSTGQPAGYTLTLSGANTYAGSTVIGDGTHAVTVELAGGSAGSPNLANSNITINSGATLEGSAASPGWLRWNINGDTGDLITVDGTLNLSDLNLVVDIVGGVQTKTQYIVANDGGVGTISGQFGASSVLPTGWNLFYTVPNEVVLTVPAVVDAYWDPAGVGGTGSDGNNVWDDSTPDWSINGVPHSVWGPGDTAFIGAGGTGPYIITVDASAIQVNGITFQALTSGQYTIAANAGGSLDLYGTVKLANDATISAPIPSTDSGSLNIVGTSTTANYTLTLTGADGSTASTTIGDGTHLVTLAIGAGGSLGSTTAITSNITVEANATLTGSGTLNYVINGNTSTNPITVASGGVLNLTDLALHIYATNPTANQYIIATYSSPSDLVGTFGNRVTGTPLGGIILYPPLSNEIVLDLPTTIQWAQGGVVGKDGSGTWDTTPSNKDWSENSNLIPWPATPGAAGDYASIGNDTGATGQSYKIIIDSNGVKAAGLFFNQMPSGTTYTIASDGATGDVLNLAGVNGNAATISLSNNAAINAQMVVSSSGLLITGADTLTLGIQANTNPGGTTVEGGATVNFQNSQSFGAASTNNNITIGAGGGTLQFGAPGLTLANDLTLNANGIIDAGGTANGAEVYSGNITDLTGFTLTIQDGTVELITGVNSGTNGNFTTGTLQIGGGTAALAGTVQFTSTANLPSTSANAITLDAGTLAYVGSSPLADALANNFFVSSGPTNAIDGNGAVISNNEEVPLITLSGTITDTGGTLTLQNGIFDLTGTNNTASTFSGGTLQVGDGTDSSTLEFTSATNLPEAAAGITLDAGTLENQNTTAAVTVLNNLTLDPAGGTIDTPHNSTTMFTGSIADGTGAGSLTLTDLGTVVLDPAVPASGLGNTYSGGTTINGRATAVIDANIIDTAPYDSEEVLGTGPLTLTGGATLETQNSYATPPSDYGMTINVGGDLSMSGATLKLALLGRPNTTIAGLPAYDSVNLLNNSPADFTGGGNTLTLVSAPGFTPADFDQYTVVKTTGPVTAPTNATGQAIPFTPDSTFTTTASSLAVRLPSSTDPNFTANRVYYFESVDSGGVVVTAQTLFVPRLANPTPNELAVATYFDQYATPANIAPTSTEALILQQLSLLPADQMAAELNEFTSEAASEAAGGIGIENGIFNSQQVFGQISNIFDGIAGFNAAGLSVLNTPNADPFTAAMNSAMQSNAQAADSGTRFLDAWGDYSNGNNAWGDNSWENAPVPLEAPTPAPLAPSGTPANILSGFLSGQVVIAKVPGANGYNPDFTTGNAIAGVNYEMASRLAVGAFFQYGYTGAKLDSAGSHLTDHSYSPGVFAGVRKGGSYLDVMGSYTYNDYTQHRQVFGTTASSSPAGNQADLSAMAGIDFGAIHHPGFKFGPAVGLAYTYLNVDSYTESGSPFDLNVSSQTVNSVRSLLGMRFSDTTHWGHSPLPWGWNINAFWQHEYLNNSQSITASVASLGGSFVINTAAPSRDTALVGGGVNGYINQNISVFVNYEAQFGQQSQLAQSVMAGLAIALK